MKKALSSPKSGCSLRCLGSALLVVALVIALFISFASRSSGLFKGGSTRLFKDALGGSPSVSVALPASFALVDTPLVIALNTLVLDSHLSGELLQNYNSSDPFMQKVLSYWLSTCRNKDGSLCEVARNGNLQCVEFVTGAFALAGISLPYAPDARDFWPDYQNKQVQSTWQEIPIGSALPEMGDIVVWRTWHYDTAKKVRVEDVGHVAIVVATVPPQGNTPGKAYLAQANAPSTITVRQALDQDAGGALVKVLGEATLNARLGELMLSPNLSVVDNKALENNPTSSGSVVVGYIRYVSPLSMALPRFFDNQTCATSRMPSLVQRQWVPVACSDARKYHISSQLFINQIYLESAFNPKATSANTHAEGIAQFESSTVHGKFNPFDPATALDAAAHLLSNYYCGYLNGNVTAYVDGKLGLSECDAAVASHAALQKSEAYEKALAAYKSGPGAVGEAVARCGDASWYQCLGSDIQLSIDFIIIL